MEILGVAGTGSAAIRWIAVMIVLVILVYQERHGMAWFTLAQELTIAVSAYFLYFGVRGLTEGGADIATAHAWDIVNLEDRLGLAREADWQALIINHRWLVNLANWLYIWGHWPVIVVTAIWLYLHHPDAYGNTRDAFLVSGAIGLAVFAFYPVAPPRLIDTGLVDTVTLHSNAYRVLQPPALVNQYAAMPSLHFGWNLLVGLVIMREAANPLARGFGAVSPVLMFLAVILTGNHFILDTIVGGALALFALGAVTWLRRTRSQSGDEPVTDAIARSALK